MLRARLTALVPPWPIGAQCPWSLNSLGSAGLVQSPGKQHKAKASSLHTGDFKHPGWLPKGKQNLNPTVLKSLVEHTRFFPPQLSPEPGGRGAREQALNKHPAGGSSGDSLAMAGGNRVRCTKETGWQVLGLGDGQCRHLIKLRHAKELLRLVTRNSKEKGLA